VPGRGDGRALAESGTPRYRRPSADLVEAATRRLWRTGRTMFDSQAGFLQAVLKELRSRDPLASVGARRLRRLLIEAGAVRFRVQYTTRTDRRPLTRCPVCGEGLRPILNATLLGDRVTLGYRCPTCGYWTHLQRRVPRRYSVSAGRTMARSSG
jgi:hypothetical protein